MIGFIFNSRQFQRQLRGAPHHAGEVEFLRSVLTPGMHAVEVGANRGVTAVAMAEKIGDDGHLYAFEPVPEFCKKLRENLRRNDAHNVSPHQLALSNRRGRVEFYKHGEGSGITPSDNAEVLYVEATTVTDFLAEQEEDRLDFLNLDCEGSELLVLQGAEDTLRQQAPQIFCEIHQGYLSALDQSAGDVLDFLSELGYQVRPLQVEKLDAECSAEECSHLYAWKTPRERETEYLKRKMADLKDRMPAHSVKPSMMQELEELEEELRAIRQGLSR